MLRRPPRSTLFPSRRSSDLCDWTAAWFAVAPLLVCAAAIEALVCLVLAPGPAPWMFMGLFCWVAALRSEEHTSELQSQFHLVCRLLLEKKKKKKTPAL